MNSTKAENLKLKFDDFSFIFNFLFENRKEGRLTDQETTKIKKDFIDFNQEVLQIYEKSKTENHKNLLPMLKSFLLPKPIVLKCSAFSADGFFEKKGKHSLNEEEKYIDNDDSRRTPKEAGIRKNKKFFTQLDSGKSFLCEFYFLFYIRRSKFL